MGKRTIPIELDLPDPPATPDLASDPIVGDLRERLARLEERTSSDGVDPAAAEALRLAGEAQTAAASAVAAVEKLGEKLERAVPTPAPVVEVHPPAPIAPPVPPTPELPSQEHHPFWHPKRWL